MWWCSGRSIEIFTSAMETLTFRELSSLLRRFNPDCPKGFLLENLIKLSSKNPWSFCKFPARSSNFPFSQGMVAIERMIRCYCSLKPILLSSKISAVVTACGNNEFACEFIECHVFYSMCKGEISATKPLLRLTTVVEMRNRERTHLWLISNPSPTVAVAHGNRTWMHTAE